LHLVTAEDYWWLHPLTTPQLVTGNARRLQQEGVSPAQTDHGVDVVAGAVESDGALTRTELRDRLNAAGVRAAPAPLERDEALTLLARRYLAGHGPADARDLAKWAGVPLRDARCGLDGISDELAHRDDGLIDLADRAPAAGLPPPRLLGAYEPLLLGWVSRDQVVGRHGQIVTTNGLFRPFALVGGRVVATWSLAAATVSIKALEPIAKKTLAALEADADDVLRFLGLADGRKSRRHAASR
jgi:hypothetical protein